MRPANWNAAVTGAVELRLDDALDDIVDVATKLTSEEGPAVSVAAEIASVSIRFRPDAGPLAL